MTTPDSIEEIRQNITNTFDESDRPEGGRVFDDGLCEEVLKAFDFCIETFRDSDCEFGLTYLREEADLNVSDSDFTTILSFLSNSSTRVFDMKAAYENEDGTEVRVPMNRLTRFIGTEEARLGEKTIKSEDIYLWLEATERIITLIYKED